ncbi:MAG: helix-turn-helix transcriptional regulator [Tissierellia bacterium]|nr:helix-turn-helix transcriptional regulator [Tissierellia bacterium]
MYRTEIAFIKAIRENDYSIALESYEQIFEEMMKTCTESKRRIKNYLITLNAMMYRSFEGEEDILEKLYKQRIRFNDSLEGTTDETEIKDIGISMLDYYMDIFNGKSIKTENNTVNQALNHMNKNLHENLTIGVVASEIHISKSYLSSLLAKHTRASFPELLTQMRISTAKRLLRNTNLSILDISYRCGFNSQSYFCSTFKKQTGYTPTDFRENKHEK